MHKITIHNLGPVKDCNIALNDFMVFTGEQASGKSTISKSIFFFRNMKEVLFEIINKKYFFKTLQAESNRQSIKNLFIKEIRSNFLQTFGSTWCMDNSMYMKYFFNESTYIHISLLPDSTAPNYIWIDFSSNLIRFLQSLEREYSNINVTYQPDKIIEIKERIDTFFEDEYEVIYIPAGRSISTILGNQINYFYSMMDDMQKRTLDYCTTTYLERIIRLKSIFTQSLDELVYTNSIVKNNVNKTKYLNRIVSVMKEILQGEYRNVDGEERLQISEDRYIKINFASSGQQEVVWILNILFYSILIGKKSCFIIEEPESHLFPNSQKLVAEYISLARYHGNNQTYVTTHSPYILGAFNNLLYANKLSQEVNKSKIEKIIPYDEWIKFREISAYYIKDGNCDLCMDNEFEAIDSDVIDEASIDINRDFDLMLELRNEVLNKECE